MHPIRLKGIISINVELRRETTHSINIDNNEGDSLTQVQQPEQKEQNEQNTLEIKICEPQPLKKACVSFVSDDGIETTDDSLSLGKARKTRRWRGELLMEDRLVERKDKLRLINEAMRWLKPPLTTVCCSSGRLFIWVNICFSIK